MRAYHPTLPSAAPLRFSVWEKLQPTWGLVKNSRGHLLPLQEQPLAYRSAMSSLQWRRQDLLRGVAKVKIWSWGTQGRLQAIRPDAGCMSNSFTTNNFVTNAIPIEKAVSCWQWHASYSGRLHRTRFTWVIVGSQIYSKLLKWTKMKLLEVEGARAYLATPLPSLSVKCSSTPVSHL